MSSPINPTNANPQAPLPAKKKGGCVKWGAGLFGGFIALSIIAGMIGDDTPTSSSPITSATASTAKSAELPASTTAAAHELASTNEESAPVVQDVPKEYKSALKKAEIYSEKMHMSKAGLFEQLTSEYGEKFSLEAAQYAVDNITADWNANALAKARIYQDSMAMSPQGIYDQLVSEYGERFTPEQAQFAINNL